MRLVIRPCGTEQWRWVRGKQRIEFRRQSTTGGRTNIVVLNLKRERQSPKTTAGQLIQWHSVVFGAVMVEGIRCDMGVHHAPGVHDEFRATLHFRCDSWMIEDSFGRTWVY